MYNNVNVLKDTELYPKKIAEMVILCHVYFTTILI